jgi:sulfur carrier protein ThiS
MGRLTRSVLYCDAPAVADSTGRRRSKIGPVPAKLTYRGETYEVPDGLSVKEALIQIGLEPQLYLAVRDGRLVTEDQKLKPGDQVKLVAIVSGGGLPGTDD